MLASQGFTVMKISPSTYRNRGSLTRSEKPKKSQFKVSNRKAEIDGFMNSLDEALGVLEEKNEELQEYLIKSEKEYGQAIETANSFYKEIEEVL